MSPQYSLQISGYKFDQESITALNSNRLAKDFWPVVYVLSHAGKKLAYVGETADALTRMTTHLHHSKKGELTAAHLITSDTFNKSATLDVESKLIRYMAADGKFKLMNGNLGLADHNYYQKEELYSQLFTDIWDKLRGVGLVQHSIEHINNTDLFKYSPYKSLSQDQVAGLMAILKGLLCKDTKSLLVNGGAGTGKSVLATFLFKLLKSGDSDVNFSEFSDDEKEMHLLVNELRQIYPDPKIALVVPMSSFRKTLKKAFAGVEGLSAKMVVGPSDIAKEAYDIILVDEAHRLRKRTNLGAYFGAFDKAAAKLGLDKQRCNELDWVLHQSDKSIFFYDENQSIKPSDVDRSAFEKLEKNQRTKLLQLKSQFRVNAGNDYVDFVQRLLDNNLGNSGVFLPKNYEFKLFDSAEALVTKIHEKDAEHGLARLIAGYSWPWISKKDKAKFDIQLGGVRLQWNSTSADWINAANSVAEVGCIHTTQGYDLNYAGIIFGHEIGYDPVKQEIVINPDNYHDKNGKQSIRDPQQLKKYILNIYKTILLRGIKGTYVYACDENLRNYLSKYIQPSEFPVAQKKVVANVIELKPYVNAVPFYDLEVAAGDFSSVQKAEQQDWQLVPDDVVVSKSLFACRVVGESMNRVIPNNSICLFRSERGGSRNGKIVLVEHSDAIDGDTGSNYTVKEYQSIKREGEGGWEHKEISLIPKSNDPSFEPIVLTEGQLSSYRVIGEFVRVLG